MLSCVPAPSSFLNTSRNCPTFCCVICFNGLNRCASYVRLYISQSSGLGFVSICSVTGANGGRCASTADTASRLARTSVETTRITSILLSRRHEDYEDGFRHEEHQDGFR